MRIPLCRKDGPGTANVARGLCVSRRLCVLDGPTVPMVTGHALIPGQHPVSEVCCSLLPSAVGAQLLGWESLCVFESGLSGFSPG